MIKKNLICCFKSFNSLGLSYKKKKLYANIVMCKLQTHPKCSSELNY